MKATPIKFLFTEMSDTYKIEPVYFHQCMHIGSYDDEPITVVAMEQFAKEKGYSINITSERLHHEIYFSDPRKADVSKMKTVIRHPIKRHNRRLL